MEGLVLRNFESKNHGMRVDVQQVRPIRLRGFSEQGPQDDQRRKFSEKVAVMGTHQRDEEKGGAKWQLMICHHLVFRTPEMETSLRVVDSQDGSAITAELARHVPAVSRALVQKLFRDLWGFLTLISKAMRGLC